MKSERVEEWNVNEILMRHDAGRLTKDAASHAYKNGGDFNCKCST
jgi:hypothetical protein